MLRTRPWGVAVLAAALMGMSAVPLLAQAGQDASAKPRMMTNGADPDWEVVAVVERTE